MAEFRMPSLGADMQEGTLVEWYIKPGDRVRRGDIVAVVETVKADIEIEIFEDGVVEEIRVQEGQKVPVGTVMAIIRAETAEPQLSPESDEVHTTQPPMEAVQPKAEAGETLSEKPPASEARRLKISPAARRFAAEHGLDLTTVQATGADNAIQLADVEKAAAAEETAAKTAEGPGLPVSEGKSSTEKAREGMRGAIAAAMSRSNREIPHYYLEQRIDMTAAIQRLETENRSRPIKQRILPVVLLIKAAALALADVPELNGYWIEDHFQPQEAIHIGFAVSLRQGGLITPAVHHADLKSLDELMDTLRDLIPRARSGRLRSSEMTDATVTLTSLGDMGVNTVYGVIYPPQVALIGFGRITEQPWAESGMLGIRPVITATLAGDHRATDGHRGGRFLDALARYLRKADKL